MFTLYSISNGLELWSANPTSIYENSELKVSKFIKYFGEISNNLPEDCQSLFDVIF